MDPVTGWPFFIDHGSRRTTWDDPRYYEPGSNPSASASFQNYPSNPSPSQPERCHEITNSRNFQSPSIHYSFDRKTPIRAENTLTEQFRNSLGAQIEPGNVGPKAVGVGPLVMESSVSKHSHRTPNSTQKEGNNFQEQNVTGAHGSCISNYNSEGTMVSQDFTDNEESKLMSPEIKRIEEIMLKSIELEKKVLSYSGTVGTKDYVFLEESLMDILLLLDKVETHGNSEIRKIRKSAVCRIQELLTILEKQSKR